MESFLAWLIESSLLVLMIFGIRKLFSGKISYAGIYALWLVVLIRLMIPVNFISTPVSVSNLLEERFFQQSDTAAEPKIQSAEERTEERVQQYKVNVNSAGRVMDRDNQLRADEAGFLSERGLTEVQGPVIEDEVTAVHSDWMPVLKIIRLLVSVLLFLWIFVSNLCLLRKIKKSRVLYGKRESVKIYSTNVVKNPCLYGFFRPAVYVPEHLIPERAGCQRRMEELDQIITHELVHYHHKDHIWAICRIILVSVYWFNPFIWMAASASRKDAELFCDEAVIRVLGEENRFSYGEMLVRLAGEHSWGDFRYSMMSMSRRGKEMANRIRAISIRKRYSRWVIIPLASLLLIAVAITGSAGYGPLAREKSQSEEEEKGADPVTGSAVSQEEEEENIENPEDDSTNYQQWMKEFASADSIVFFTNPYIGKMTGTGQPGVPGLQNHSQNYSLDDESYGFLYSNAAETPEEAFGNYIQTFTDAVNSGDIVNLSSVLAVDSKAYEQQCALVKNYYKRGIREEIRYYDVTSTRTLDKETAEISSKESFNVSYADGTSKVIDQKYRYTCRSINGSWIISGMKAI